MADLVLASTKRRRSARAHSSASSVGTTRWMVLLRTMGRRKRRGGHAKVDLVSDKDAG
jgi:hypothetical protein